MITNPRRYAHDGAQRFQCPYASFADAQLPLLKAPALWFDKLAVLDPVGGSRDTVGVDDVAREALRLLKVVAF